MTPGRTLWHFSSLSRRTRDRRSETLLSERSVPDQQRLREQIREYGENSNAFLTLYPGFRYFTSKDDTKRGVIAFANTGSAWIGASEPLAAPEEQRQLLTEFAQCAKESGKAAALFPVGGGVAATARRAGYGAILIGSEPIFQFDRYDPSPECILVARQMQTRGARVREFTLDKLRPGDRAALDEIVDEWLRSRKTTELGFLNRVMPWHLHEDKKYFLIAFKDRLLAFLAAVPGWKRNSWYLLDLLKRDEIPSGTTELLLLEAMRLLKEQGAKEVSLGVAPLADLDGAPTQEHPVLYPLLRTLYRSGAPFYQFQSLHRFKLKFKPTACEPAFLICAPSKPTLKLFLGLIDAFIPSGLIDAVRESVSRKLAELRLSDYIKSQISSRVVVRSVPPSFFRLLLRCRFTTALVAAQVAVYFVNSRWIDRAGSVARHAFSFNSVRELGLFHGTGLLITASFLHWNFWHLATNILLLIAFGGLLEYLAGSLIAGSCFLIAVLLANPLNFALCILPLQFLSRDAWLTALSEKDLGASLGILGCMGGLLPFLRHRVIYAAIITSIIVCGAILHGSAFFLNHLTGFIAGMAVSWLILEI